MFGPGMKPLWWALIPTLHAMETRGMRAAERAAVGSAALLVLLQWQQKRREKAWHLWIMAVYFWALAGGFGD